MAWVVDTCVLIDVISEDARFGERSADCLVEYASSGLALCPVSYIEMAPSFYGDRRGQETFLSEVEVDFSLSWEWADTVAAHQAWSRFIELNRKGKMKRRPIADVQIGAFASRFEGLITRNGNDFKTLFPELNIVEPKI
jgi:predicted nucleic acid-binding protein